MPFNGSGAYTAAASSWNPAVAETTIDESDWNTLLADIETSLSLAICKDGQSATSAAIPFASGVKTDSIAENGSGNGITVSNNLLMLFGLLPAGRLTLTTGTPVTTSDVTAAATVYYTPHKGDVLPLYNGTNWEWFTFSEVSVSVPATTDTMYDVFVYDSSGTITLDATAWTNDTTRATALATQDGVYVKTGATGRRYVGSFRTTGSSGQTEDSLAKRYVWNYYNRVARPMRVLEATDSWNYTTATYRQANGSTANQLDMVIGVSEDAVSAEVRGAGANGGVISMSVGIGLDSTSALATGCLNVGAPNNQVANVAAPMGAAWNGFPGAGRHYLAWLEQSAASGTTTWYGDNGGPTLGQSGIHGVVLG